MFNDVNVHKFVNTQEKLAILFPAILNEFKLGKSLKVFLSTDLILLRFRLILFNLGALLARNALTSMFSI